MKNIPRIFISNDIAPGIILPAPSDTVHYLRHVMRRGDFLTFANGHEFTATLSDDNKNIVVGACTSHDDPSNDITLMFSPIKRTDDLLNMATQMGVRAFVPVIMERTVASHINWNRMQKIVIEASEQSNRNSVPEIMPPVRFSDMDLSDIVFADERCAYGTELPTTAHGATKILIGPEGGFSPAEFSALDNSGAIGISLGKTILRAELAAAVAISRISLQEK